MVEFALVLPLLMIVLFGIIQFGIAFKDYIELTDAVRAGARAAAVSRNDTVPGEKARTQLTEAGMENVSVTVDNLTPDGKWAPGATVTVSATHHFDISLLGIVVKSGDLHSMTKERIE
jgi:Flp pilus assembly protein TadG